METHMKLKSMNKFILSVCFLLVTLCIFGQNRKYWYYKTRLNNDFVKVGLGDGESMPFNQRGLNSISFNSTDGKLNLGDGVSTLGYYVALLATEYRLLVLNKQSTIKVKHELFCALNAFNRLDAKAENAPSGPLTSLNGFFVRDDIPGDFITKNNYQNYSHFNYYDNGHNNNNTSHGFHSKLTGDANTTRSDWERKYDPNSDDGTASDISESQDQTYNMLFGLAFINKYIPTSEKDGNNVFGYGSGETSLTLEARNMAKRIIDHIRDPKKISNGSSCNGNFATGWKIKNPTTCNPVPTGSDAQTFAYALAETECLITNGYSSNSGGQIGLSLLAAPQLCNGGGYHNTWSKTAGFTAWTIMASSPNYDLLNPNNYIDTRVFIENLSAVCNCVYGTVADKTIDTIVSWLEETPLLSWLGVAISWIWHVVSAIIHSFSPGYYLNNTATSINVNAYLPGSPIDHGPLARNVLHGGLYVPNSNYTMDYLLDVMPCDDIYFFGNQQYGHREWSSTDRLDHPNRIGGDTDFKGEYNGIDFMLYHNLWNLHLIQDGTYGYNMQDVSNIVIDPTTNLTCSNVNAYETITTNNVNIGCTNPTYWRAGKTIYFGAGTSITGNGSSITGPNFHAYIQKFDCSSDNGVFRMANSDSTIQGNSTVNNDSYEQGVKYHTVNYPKDDETSLVQASYKDDKTEENLITELPIEEDPIEKIMKATYIDYSKELFIKPTVTIDNVKAYFTMDNNEMAFISVLDLNGKKVYENNNIKATDTGLTIDLSELANGTYLLKFTTTNGTNKTQKIIKQ